MRLQVALLFNWNTENGSVHTTGACILSPHSQTGNQNPPSSSLSAVIFSGYEFTSAYKSWCILFSYTLHKGFILSYTIVFVLLYQHALYTASAL